jgi:Asp-tRNA(Asn)/Glu-tRNA(Gln) amidotransferase A subunit family amidase
MTELHKMTACQAVAKVTSGDITVEALVADHLAHIADRDDAVRAWTHLDPEAALAAARAMDKSGATGPLAGVPIAVKDLIDTGDMPTTYGSAIYAGHQPKADATVVADSRAQGGLILGKSVSTEFAWRNPGPTRNPHNPAHTPGGSSSGSAAAVADYQAMLGFGTQTAGSVIRPAAYCGVVGFKPTRGSYSTEGVKPLSPYLDTVGLFARAVADIALFDRVLRGRDEAAPQTPDRGPRCGVLLPYKAQLGSGAEAAIDRGRHAVETAGGTLIDMPFNQAFEDLAARHNPIMLGDAGRNLATEYRDHSDALVPFYREKIAEGQAIDDATHRANQAEADRLRVEMAAMFHGFDLILTPPAPGEAPLGLDATGDPVFNANWTLLGWPCLTLPAGRGPGGLPVGVQLVAPFGSDQTLLTLAAMIEPALQKHNS